MDLQHTNHRRNKDIFSKAKNSSISCIAFHFHCTIIKPVDGKKATVTTEHVVPGHLCDGGITAEKTWQLGVVNCTKHAIVQVVKHWESEGEWNTLIIRNGSSFSGHISWLMISVKLLELYFTISGTQDPLQMSTFILNPGNSCRPGW